jgi:hypothetical protein
MIKKLQRIAAWLPILWKDEDWDQAYMVRMIQFKLRRMAKVLENGHTMSGPRDARRMREVCAHFDRYEHVPGMDAYEVDFWEEGRVIKTKRVPNPGFIFWRSQADSIDTQEQWHWGEAWRKIARYGQGWWD